MSTLLGGRHPIVQAVTLSRYRGAFTDRQAAVLAAGRGHLAHTLRRIQDEPTRVLQLAPEVTWVSSALNLARPAATPADTPTRRQQEILSLVATGLTDTQIGRRLGLSPTTVSKHLTRCYARLGNELDLPRGCGTSDHLHQFKYCAVRLSLSGSDTVRECRKQREYAHC